MELVARELSWLLGLPLEDVLVRRQGKDQRDLGRSDRLRNLSGSVELVGDVDGLRVLLVDDVVTTGASLAACTEALMGGRATQVSACTLARVW